MKEIMAIGILIITVLFSNPTKAQMTACANIFAQVVAPGSMINTSDFAFAEVPADHKNQFDPASNEFCTSKRDDDKNFVNLMTYSIANYHHAVEMMLTKASMMMEKRGIQYMTTGDSGKSASASKLLSRNLIVVNGGACLQISKIRDTGMVMSQNTFVVTLNCN